MSRSERYKLVICGVGGQGVLTAAIMVGDAALDRGLRAVVGQLHGMSQRGGSVETTVLMGPGQSSFVEPGGAHAVLAFEPLEALRALPYMGPDTRALVNVAPVVPLPLSMQGLAYPDPDGLLEQLRQVTPHVLPLPGPRLLLQVGEPRALNMLMLGALAGQDLLPLPAEAVRAAARRRSKPRFRELNLRAFDLGAAFKG